MKFETNLNFVIYPSYKKFKSSKQISKYSSMNNKDFLSSNELKKLIKDNFYSFELEK